MASKSSAIVVLRVELLDIEPLIWRRIRVTRTTTFETLHEILQRVLGWQNSHLHEFRAGDLVLGDTRSEDAGEREGLQDEREWSLAELIETGVQEFEYVYDFGDHWAHRIVLEPATRAGHPGASPLCLSGENACPPEDVGGPHLYREFLQALSDPRHKQHAQYLRWIGGVWDPKGFDLNRVNRELRQLEGKGL